MVPVLPSKYKQTRQSTPRHHGFFEVGRSKNELQRASTWERDQQSPHCLRHGPHRPLTAPALVIPHVTSPRRCRPRHAPVFPIPTLPCRRHKIRCQPDPGSSASGLPWDVCFNVLGVQAPSSDGVEEPGSPSLVAGGRGPRQRRAGSRASGTGWLVLACVWEHACFAVPWRSTSGKTGPDVRETEGGGATGRSRTPSTASPRPWFRPRLQG